MISGDIRIKYADSARILLIHYRRVQGLVGLLGAQLHDIGILTTTGNSIRQGPFLSLRYLNPPALVSSIFFHSTSGRNVSERSEGVTFPCRVNANRFRYLHILEPFFRCTGLTA